MMTLTYAPIEALPISEEYFTPQEAPVCPILPKEFEQKVTFLAREHAATIERVTTIWQNHGIGFFRIQIPELDWDWQLKNQSAVNYELARRIASIMITNGCSVTLSHYSAHLNVITQVATANLHSARSSAAQSIARSILDDVYKSVNNGLDVKSDALAHAVNRRIMAMAESARGTGKGDQPVITPSLENLHAATWDFVQRMAPNVLGARPDCIWRLKNNQLDVRVIDKPTTVWSRLKLRVGGWKQVDRLQRNTGCCG